MIEKDTLSVGDVLRVRERTGPKDMATTTETLTLWGKDPAGGFYLGGERALGHTVIDVMPGEMLKLVKKPARRENGINYAVVERISTGDVAAVYWCDLRVSCDMARSA